MGTVISILDVRIATATAERKTLDSEDTSPEGVSYQRTYDLYVL
jgi:hypothetical protein